MEELEKRFLATSRAQINLLRKLLHRGAHANLVKVFNKAHPVDAARVLAQLTLLERDKILPIILDGCGSARTAAILSAMEEYAGAELMETLEPKVIARLLSELPADDATSLMSRLPQPLADQVLESMEKKSAEDVEGLLGHGAQTAGRIMSPDYFALEEKLTVAEAIAEIQRRAERSEMIFYLYVVDERNHLLGVISLRRLLTSPPSSTLRQIMTPEVIKVDTATDQEEVARLVSEYKLLAIPVVDEENKLAGLVTVDDAIEVYKDEATEDLLALSGVAKEEHIQTGALRSLRLRTPWLMVNLGTAFLASWVVSRFESQIGSLPALAVLMPIVAGLGGNSATQTLAVVIRGLALGELTNIAGPVLKSLLVGLSNGIINGLSAAAVTFVLYGNLRLGLVLAAAMVINMVVAGLAGTLIPLGLRLLRIDPAVASSVFVTACTDAVGFFSFLGIASTLLDILKAG